MPIRARYAQISDDDLKLEIVKIHEEHPNAGQTVRFQMRLSMLFLFSFTLCSFTDGTSVFKSSRFSCTKI